MFSKVIFIFAALAVSGIAHASSVVLHEQNVTHTYTISRAAVTPYGVQVFVTGDKLACLIDASFLKSTGASGYEVMKDLSERSDRTVECSQGVAKEIKTDVRRLTSDAVSGGRSEVRL